MAAKMTSGERGYPRVLFISTEPPQDSGAGAMLFRRLFANYPAGQLRVVTNARLAPPSERLACPYVRIPLAADRLLRTRWWPYRAILRAMGASDLVRGRRIDDAIRGFEPDVVVALMQDSWLFDIAARFARRRRLPLVLFVHDLPHVFEPVPPLLQRLQRARDARVYRQAARRYCVSAPMADYFRQRFGVSGDVMMPPSGRYVEPQAIEATDQLKSPPRLTIGYAGGLHYGYGEQLLAMLPILRAEGARVELFGAEPAGIVAPLKLATDVFHINGRLSAATAWQLLRDRCDVVLQPYLNPPGPHAQQYATHFPSKLGDYLALGVPLLVTGPSNATGVDWCLRHPGCALVVTEPATSALQTAVGRLKNDSALRRELALGALAAASAFDLVSTSAQFYTDLCDVVGRHRDP